MTLLYNFIIVFYKSIIAIVALFGNPKARLWIAGRRNLFSKIRNELKPCERRIWLHAASLGEFEQGRPIIEKIRELYPQYKIVLTFFSPSGYEVRKNYTGADYIFYMPADTALNALKFVDLINPEKVFFIKYEFWYNFLLTLKSKNIPVYLCSAIFRPNQLFFKWYGAWYRRAPKLFTHIFVQNEESKNLLETINITNVSVAGDTRFDRVYAIATQAREISEIEKFVAGKTCVIAGSTWQPDEDLLIQYINSNSFNLKFIIAPHEIHAENIERLESSIKKRVIRFSKWNTNPEGDFDVLIIDNIGMLASLYRYGKLAYIGGGFGKGIHNILEASTFGLPVIFGPQHIKFKEAVDLVATGGAFAISDFNSLKQKFDSLIENPSELEKTSTIASSFVKKNIGATTQIITSVF